MTAAFTQGFLRLKEHPARFAYLVASLAVTTLAWLVLSSVAGKFSAGSAAKEGSVITVMADRQGRPLPLRYVSKLREVDGVADVAFMTFIPVMCREPATVATLNAWDIPAGRYQTIVGDNAAAAAISTWLDDAHGILAGARLAADCGWTPGITIEPIDLFNSRPLQISVSAVLPPSGTGSNDQIAFAHYAYISRVVPESDRDTIQAARIYPEKGTSAADLAIRLEQAFASEIEPIRANPNAESEGMLSRFTTIAVLLWLVAAALAACTVLIYISAFAHMAAQRRASMATLQAIGFTRFHLQAGMLIEIAAATLSGACLGVVLAEITLYAMVPHVSLYLGKLAPTASAYITLIVGAGVLVLVSALLPIRIISQVPPADRNAA